MDKTNSGKNGKRKFKRPWYLNLKDRMKKGKGAAVGRGNEPENGTRQNGKNCNGLNGHNEGRDQNENRNNKYSKKKDRQEDHNENDTVEHGQPKKKRRRLENIKSQIIAEWERRIPGYSMYYPKIPPQIPEFKKKFDIAVQYLQCNGYTAKNKLAAIEEDEYFDLLSESIVKDHDFNEKWPEFSIELVEEPQEVLNIWGLAMFKIVHDLTKDEPKTDIDDAEDGESTKTQNVSRIKAGIMKFEPVTPLIQIKSSLVGKFITIRGAVVRMGNIRPFVTHMTFLCKICDTTFSLEQPEGKITYPVRCGTSEDCESSIFEAVEDSTTTKLVNSRMIRIQDMNCNEVDPGSVPRCMDCELFSNFVNRCAAGNAVTLTGIVKMSKEVTNPGGGDQSLHKIYLEVVSIRNHKDSERTMGGHWFSFSNKDYYAIKEIHDTENLFRLLVASICPSIYGHEIVKAGLLLCLFGGTSQQDRLISRRSDINMLMVGDPGIGKSQMLKMVTEIAPRGVYVCGNGSTVAGLTVTLVKEGNDYSIEAGALVMADRGVCCIDEFDKMQNQHNALLEAMEQQSISIAKSGAFRTIPARATVIAAANPVGGHYDKTKSVNENIKMTAALMSRFDLVFILLDKPNQEFDGRVVEHIMGGQTNKTYASQSQSHNSSLFNDRNEAGYVPLIDRIKFGVDEEVDVIPHLLIRKYVAYAKQYVRPIISPEAAVVLKEYFLKLRVKHRLIDSTPVTTRQLESLVRLTEARAKVELREVATADDAKDVLEIFESSLSSAFDDEVIAISALSQSILISSCASNKTQASKSNAKKLVCTLQRYAEQQSKNIFSMDEIRQLSSALGLRSVVDSLVANLNNEGYLLKKGGQIYQLQSIDF